MGLKEFEVTLSKQRARKLPTSLEDVYEPGLMDKLRSFYHRQNRTKEKVIRRMLEESIECDVRMSVFAESTYEADRRPTFHTLEGYLNKTN